MAHSTTILLRAGLCKNVYFQRYSTFFLFNCRTLSIFEGEFQTSSNSSKCLYMRKIWYSCSLALYELGIFFICSKFPPDFKHSKNGCICLKFGTHVLWHNTQLGFIIKKVIFFTYDIIFMLPSNYCEPHNILDKTYTYNKEEPCIIITKHVFGPSYIETSPQGNKDVIRSLRPAVKAIGSDNPYRPKP